MGQLHVVRNREEANAHNPNKPALVEVRGELVQSVMFLVEALKRPNSDRLGKLARNLLRSMKRRDRVE